MSNEFRQIGFTEDTVLNVELNETNNDRRKAFHENLIKIRSSNEYGIMRDVLINYLEIESL